MAQLSVSLLRVNDHGAIDGLLMIPGLWSLELYAAYNLYGRQTAIMVMEIKTRDAEFVWHQWHQS